MKSINKTKNDSISEQASATKEEMIEFASKYKNIEAFKDLMMKQRIGLLCCLSY